MSVRVAIDRDLCIGSGTCTRLAPGAFVLDDDEVATVLDPEQLPLGKLRLAADACPTEAISLIEEEGDSND